MKQEIPQGCQEGVYTDKRLEAPSHVLLQWLQEQTRGGNAACLIHAVLQDRLLSAQSQPSLPDASKAMPQ